MDRLKSMGGGRPPADAGAAAGLPPASAAAPPDAFPASARPRRGRTLPGLGGGRLQPLQETLKITER